MRVINYHKMKFITGHTNRKLKRQSLKNLIGNRIDLQWGWIDYFLIFDFHDESAWQIAGGTLFQLCLRTVFMRSLNILQEIEFKESCS
jgi:hypothetical protein